MNVNVCDKEDRFFVVFYEFEETLQIASATKLKFLESTDDSVTVQFKATVLQDDGREKVVDM